MRWTILASLLVLSSTSVLALDCPDGAYRWVGRRGVEYCKRDIIGPQASGPQASGKSAEVCPAGMRPVATRQGDQVCRRPRSGG